MPDKSIFTAGLFTLAFTESTTHLIAGESPSYALQMREQVRDALRAEAAAEDQDQAKTVARLIVLRTQVADDAQLSSHWRETLSQKLNSRLLRLRDKITADVKMRQQRVRVFEQNGRDKKIAKTPASIATDQAILAQWQDVLGQFIDNGNGGQNQFDEGERLVELIENTIAPECWEANGGNGRIVYFGNLKALVVSAPGP